jgi:predicted transcriptional regulator
MERTGMERIGEAEYAVMEVLWQDAPLTATEVAERVPAERGWSIRTVKTMLARLLAKGVLAHEEEGRRYLYRPAVARADYVAQESGRLIDRMFGGRVTPLVAQLAERDRLTDADIAEIEALLKALKS